MRAYSCIDSHGRWTEIPTQVQFSTSNDAHPPQPSPRTSNVDSDVIDIDDDKEPEKDPEEDEENAREERVTALDVLNVIRKYSNQAPRSDATTCAKSSAQASSVTEDEYDELEDDDSAADEESEEDAENEQKRTQKTRSKSSQPLSPPLQNHRRAATTPPVPPLPNRRHAATLPLALSHPRKPCRETLFAAKIRMTGRPLTAPIAPPCPDLQGVHPRNRPLLKNRSPTPTAAYGTNAPAIRIRRSRSQMPRAASRTKST